MHHSRSVDHQCIGNLEYLSTTGGAAELSRAIDVGDEVLAINSHPLVGLMHYDAWNLIKAAGDGPVHLVIRKPRTSV